MVTVYDVISKKARAFSKLASVHQVEITKPSIDRRGVDEKLMERCCSLCMTGSGRDGLTTGGRRCMELGTRKPSILYVGRSELWGGRDTAATVGVGGSSGCGVDTTGTTAR